MNTRVNEPARRTWGAVVTVRLAPPTPTPRTKQLQLRMREHPVLVCVQLQVLRGPGWGARDGPSEVRGIVIGMVNGAGPAAGASLRLRLRLHLRPPRPVARTRL